MVVRQFLVFTILVFGLLLFVGSCKDMGSAIPPPPPPPPQPLTASQTSFLILPGRTATAKLSGGTPPYSFASQGNTNIVLPTIVNDSLKLSAIALGNSTIIVRDAGSPRLFDTVSVSVTLLAVGQNVFNMLVGDSASTTISGGTEPYSFISKGDTTKVVPSITGTSLKILAVAAGSSSIILGDSSSPRLSVTVTANVSVVPLAVGQTTFDLLVGDSASTTISGGTPPYSFVSKGDTTKAVPSILGASLKIHALAAGSSSIVLGDNSSPRLSVTVTVNVAVLVSFSAQVQPIFTNSCVNAGCHPGGGAPFPLVASQSYNNLVGVTATNGPCAGDKRVLASNANASALIKRLEGNCGDRMPLGGNPLPSAQIQLIRDWINQGASNN
ncbi:MAG: Tryptophan synthase alpha chain [Bacteroidetes bacterium]|nr:Tryptophan synthase alpha chain [Bacteroidota bacterium]